MRILYDHQTFSQQEFGGISRYYCELIAGINKTEYNSAHLALLWSNNVHLSEYNINTLPYLFSKRKRLLYKSNKYWNLADMKVRQFDVYHATYYDPFFIKYLGTKPYVVTYYDMIYEIFSHKYLELKAATEVVRWKRIISQKAACLIAISETTKQDMVHYLNISPERIHVIHLGNSLTIPALSKISAGPEPVPYLLYVGNRTAYKNFGPFLTAVSWVLRRYGIRLICAGGGAFTTTESDHIRASGLTNFVEQLAITDKSLAQLYSQAFAFVFPSFYEGFGLPILEAYACGCPCIVSNRGALPEVAGNAALLIDPDKTESISYAVERLIQDSSLRNDLIIKGFNRLGSFSWKKTVDRTLLVYNSVSNRFSST